MNAAKVTPRCESGKHITESPDPKAHQPCVVCGLYCVTCLAALEDS